MKSIEEIYRLKNTIQEGALRTFFNHGCRGIVEIATGVGKTKIGVDLIRHVYESTIAFGRLYDKLKVMIVCPTTNLRDKEWRTELIKWCPNEIIEDLDIEFKCINSVYKLRAEEYDIIIIDEVHTTLSEKYSDFLRHNTANHVLGLSATVADTQIKKDLLSELRLPIIFRYSLTQAERDGIISDYEAYNLGIHLYEHEKIKYDSITDRINSIAAMFGDNPFPNIQACLQNRYKPKDLDFGTAMAKAKSYMKLLGDRKEIVYHAKAKYDTTIDLLFKFEKEKTIVFSEDIRFVEALHEECFEARISASKFHSQMKTKEKNNNLDSFRDNVTSVLISAKALNAGFNLPAINVGISAGGTSTGLDDTQRRGRVLRPAEGKVATYINLYCKNTIEERWVSKRSVGKKVTWINSIEQING